MNRFPCCNRGFLLLAWFILFALLDDNFNCLAQIFYPPAPLPFVILDSTTVPTTARTTSKKTPPSNPPVSPRRIWHRY
ncbi:hypothetical protein Ga0466249_004769 [Sporomusaceae bacterium BoRhaA]|uniref:hypothetical protein n=1 Tax=Pelorhabdus rhamnosifermentans TaxID=2772457 RepID=UPI001C061957|nr:hypothetical protein [Pelorhabdus rhamnosifermentans]MBU2703624.1 hypothetical protein [Pelorhabdus rhamnosifermentans]